MQKDIVFVKTNKYWSTEHIPLVSVITSNYNRREVLYRCMKSVEAQTFRDIEYIVVDNGSSVTFDDIMERFMDEATIPVMFIKRNNGIGRQTGRNSAIRRARGEYLSMIDSDDEYLPDGIQKLVNAWKQIPECKRDEYREVCCLVQDEHGRQLGGRFPDNINLLSRQDALKAVMLPQLAFEHANMSRTILLKENLFPEPEGVSSYSDSIIWWKLSKKYKSFFFNDFAKIYYTESADSISNEGKKGLNYMDCLGQLFTNQYTLNHWNEFFYTFKDRCRMVILYTIHKNILSSQGRLPQYDWARNGLGGKKNQCLYLFLLLPSKVLTPVFIKRHNGLNFK